jgi:hypothetical protein
MPDNFATYYRDRPLRVRLASCRHGFGDALRFDAVVDGVYPDGRACLWLSQPGEMYKGIKMLGPSCYVSLPFATVDCAAAVVKAFGAYHLSGTFRVGETITARPCWENCPDIAWELAV